MSKWDKKLTSLSTLASNTAQVMEETMSMASKIVFKRLMKLYDKRGDDCADQSFDDWLVRCFYYEPTGGGKRNILMDDPYISKAIRSTESELAKSGIGSDIIRYGIATRVNAKLKKQGYHHGLHVRLIDAVEI